MRALLLLPFALLAGCASVMLQPPDPPLAGTSGRFDRWDVRDAAAVRDAEGLTVIFTYLAFDRRAWVDDAQLSPEDLGRLLDNDDDYAPQLQLRLGVDGRLVAHRFTYGNYDVAWQDDSARADALTLTPGAPGRLTGTLRLIEPEHDAEITFHLPLLALGPLARPGTPLPDDGGEAGRFLVAQSRAVWEGDLDRVLALMTPEERASAAGHWDYDYNIADQSFAIDYTPGDLDLSGSSFFMLKQRMNTPRVERIVGGALDDDTAWVDFAGSEGVIGHSPITGTAVMRRDRKGRWRVDRYLMQDVPEDDELDALEAQAQREQDDCDDAGWDGTSSVFIGGNVIINGVRVSSVPDAPPSPGEKTEPCGKSIPANTREARLTE